MEAIGLRRRKAIDHAPHVHTRHLGPSAEALSHAYLETLPGEEDPTRDGGAVLPPDEIEAAATAERFLVHVATSLERDRLTIRAGGKVRGAATPDAIAAAAALFADVDVPHQPIERQMPTADDSAAASDTSDLAAFAPAFFARLIDRLDPMA